AFAAAVEGVVRFAGVAGHLGVDERVRGRLGDQTVASVSPAGGELVLEGRLVGPGGGAGVPYAATFRVVDGEALELALRLPGGGAPSRGRRGPRGRSSCGGARRARACSAAASSSAASTPPADASPC